MLTATNSKKMKNIKKTISIWQLGKEEMDVATIKGYISSREDITN